ncbi:MAG TPA: AAA family ATPase, partial [Desulfobacteria bacterium]|nr:AAA family ATPase [Desulfobacteria bacterium]
LKGIMVLAATNRVDIIDEALLRAGRFDFQFKIPVPEEGARLEILKVHTRGKPLAKGVNLDALAKASEDMVGADLESLCEKAAMKAIRKFIENKGDDYSRFTISKKNFEDALNDMKTS